MRCALVTGVQTCALPILLRQMPPLEAAEAFLAAANARSFRAGASSLALSPSAFSRRIQQLERFLGVELFHRTNSQSQQIGRASCRERVVQYGYLSVVAVSLYNKNNIILVFIHFFS